MFIYNVELYLWFTIDEPWWTNIAPSFLRLARLTPLWTAYSESLLNSVLRNLCLRASANPKKMIPVLGIELATLYKAFEIPRQNLDTLLVPKSSKFDAFHVKLFQWVTLVVFTKYDPWYMMWAETSVEAHLPSQLGRPGPPKISQPQVNMVTYLMLTRSTHTHHGSTIMQEEPSMWQGIWKYLAKSRRMGLKWAPSAWGFKTGKNGVRRPQGLAGWASNQQKWWCSKYQDGGN